MHIKPIAIAAITSLAFMYGCAIAPPAPYYPPQGQGINAEYNRGYNDGWSGAPADKFRREPGYLDGYRAGQSARTNLPFGHDPKRGGSPEFNRGYDDAIKGNYFDPYNHPQDYKDGYHAGEVARRR